MRPSKWDLVLERKPVPLADHLVGELATIFADELRRWPPELTGLDAAAAEQLAASVARHPNGPPPQAFEEAFTLAAWDLEHEVQAVDEYFRNQRYLAAGLSPDDRPLLHFLSRFIVEQLLALGEATQLRRARLLVVLRRTRAVLAGQVAAAPSAH